MGNPVKVYATLILSILSDPVNFLNITLLKNLSRSSRVYGKE
jgi:hypothetical protein